MKLSNQKRRMIPFLVVRAKSWLVDHLTILFASTAIHLSFFTFYNEFIHQDLVINWSGFYTAYKVNLSLFYLSYFFSMNYFFHGQTIGQKIFGIGSINNINFSPKQISAWSSIQRSCANYLCFKLGFILFLVPLIHKRNLSLADLISQTHQSYCSYQMKHDLAA